MIFGEAELSNNLQLQTEEDLQIRPNPILSPWAKKTSSGPKTKITGGFDPDYQRTHNDYKREIPDRFKGDALMTSLIRKFAIEGATGGKPNGEFFTTKSLAHEVALEVVGTHLKLNPGK